MSETAETAKAANAANENAERADHDAAGHGAGDEAPPNPLDAALCDILARSHTIAVVGMKDEPEADANRVPAYMRMHGYVIVPVNPKLVSMPGTQTFSDLLAVSQAGVTIDIVNLFRASENVPAHVDEVLQMKPKPRAVWMQLGIHHGPSAKRLREAGIDVVQDRCIMVDHRRLASQIESAATVGS